MTPADPSGGEREVVACNCGAGYVGVGSRHQKWCARAGLEAVVSPYPDDQLAGWPPGDTPADAG